MAIENQGFDKGDPLQVTKPQVLFLQQRCSLMAGLSPPHVHSSGEARRVYTSDCMSCTALQPTFPVAP